MKNKTLKIISLIVFLILASSIVTFAANPDISILREQIEDEIIQSIVIKGKIDNYNGHDEYTIKAFDKTKNENEMNDLDYSFFDQIDVSIDGTYTYITEFAGDPKDYKFVITGENYNKTSEIYFPGLKITSDFIKSLNDRTITPKEAVNLVNKNNKDLVFDEEVFNTLKQESKENVFNIIINSTEKKNINNIYNMFNEGVILSSLNKGENVKIIREAFNHYTDVLKLDKETIFPLYESLSNKGKDEVYKYMQNKDLKNLTELKSMFFDSTILSAYKNILSYEEITDILNTYLPSEDEVIKFNNLSSKNKNYVLRYLTDERGKTNSIDEFLKKINYATLNVEEIKDKYKQKNNGLISGGGGGGSSIITMDPPKKDTNNSIDIKKGFNDLSAVLWAKDAILALYDKKILDGKEPGKFIPEDNITRAEFVKILISGLNEVSKDNFSTFKDIESHWSKDYINSAYSKGYISGKSKDEFGADQYITREDASVIIYKIISIKGKAEKKENQSITYEDLKDISSYAERSVSMLSEYGLIHGFTDNTFKPKNNLTRAEAAVLINNFFKFIEK